jgi:putative glycosyltransferase (TIGR04372 family)
MIKKIILFFLLKSVYCLLIFIQSIKIIKVGRIYIIRIGNYLDKKESLRLRNLYKLIKKNFTKKLKLYLITKSKIMVSGNTSFLNVASAYRRLTLMIDSISFNAEDFITKKQNSIIVLKKVYSIKKNRNLNLVEMINLKVGNNNKKNSFLIK